MVYLFRNHHNFDADALAKYLPCERAEKHKKLKQKTDRENCVISYLLLKYALSQLGVEEFQLKTQEHGKPYIDRQDIHFNLSHCKSGVALAIGKSPVGIDIQDMTKFSEGVMNRVCSEDEKGIILSSPDRTREFTRIWTLKEAAAKCDGRGLQIIRDFSFDSKENSFEKYGKSFRTYEFDNFFVSVCGTEEFSDIKEFTDLEDLL